jgi:hypothetical protein
MRIRGWKTIDKTPVYRLELRTETERLSDRGVVASEFLFAEDGRSLFGSSFLFGRMRFWHFEAAQVELGWRRFCSSWKGLLHRYMELLIYILNLTRTFELSFNATKGQPLLRLYEVDTSQ